MDITFLTTVVGLLVTLSIASERLVEIVKGFIPGLNREWSTPAKEGLRKAIIQVMAVFAGMVTVWLAQPVVLPVIADKLVAPPGWLVTIALGLLASGGSGFWNSILSYMLQIKDIKKVEAAKAKRSYMSA